MAIKSSDLDDQNTGAGIQLRATPSHYQVADMALKRQRHLVAPPPIHHPSPW